MTLRTVKLTLAYDGAGYVGWQRQKMGKSVQGLLEDALSQIEKRETVVTGAGRTDAGVHALGQVASVQLYSSVNEGTLVRALNASLPSEVRVLSAEQVDQDFHARYAANSKTYRYRIITSRVVSPFERRYAWHVPTILDDSKMKEAGRLIIGRHDFSAFQAAGQSTTSTIRTILKFEMKCLKNCTWSPGTEVSTGGSLITIEITGDGFLRHMVRSIIGTLVNVGKGRRNPEDVEKIILSGDHSQAGPTAPAKGLLLVCVNY